MVALISNREAYDYFKPQYGGGFFRGNLRLRGRGIGGVLSTLARTAFPILKTHVLPHVARTLLSTAGDAVAGKNLKDSLKKRSKKAGKQIFRSLIKQPPKKKRITARKKRKKTPKDIFS